MIEKFVAILINMLYINIICITERDYYNI